MRSALAEPLVRIQNVLYLTDFSRASDAALPFAIAMARRTGGLLEVLHALPPVIPESCTDAIKADRKLAEAEMRKLRSQVAGVLSKIRMNEESGVWAAVDEAIRKDDIDLVVLGTHGRTGISRFWLGSVAEEIFRRSPIPVLTVGPEASHEKERGIQFKHLLFATDFSREAEAAIPFALALAHEKATNLTLLHVMQKPPEDNRQEENRFEASVAQAIDELYRIVPSNATYNPPDVAVEYGEPAERILHVAKEKRSDLIVIGVRGATEHLGAATHVAKAIAHEIVVKAHCPVVTVRSMDGPSSTERPRK